MSKTTGDQAAGDSVQSDDEKESDLKRKLELNGSEPNNNNFTESNKIKKTKINFESPDVCIIDSISETSENKDGLLREIHELKLNPGYNEHLETLKQLYQQEHVGQIPEFVDKNFKIHENPFKVVQLYNVIANNSIIAEILRNAKIIALEEKNNDLFSLQQSRDLKNYKIFKSIVDFFQNDVKTLLEKITGAKLNNEVSSTFSKYEKNDYLLCHDDKLEKRKIAFILYLVDNNWSADDGGQLELFSLDEDGKSPAKVVERLIPKNNTLTFFEVSAHTFHQVSEVLTNRSRWSINGWFHSDEVTSVVDQQITYPLWPIIPNENLKKSPHLFIENWHEWINPYYYTNSIQKMIREKFCANSEIQIPNFIRKSKIKQLEEALNSDAVKNIWRESYMPLFHRFEYIHHEDFAKLPRIIKKFYLFITSESFYNILTLFTDLKIGKLKPSNKNRLDNENKNDDDIEIIEPKRLHRGQILQWKHGFYSLSSDINPQIDEIALDIDFFFNFSDKSLASSKELNEPEIIQIDSDDDDDGNIDDKEKNDNVSDEKNDDSVENLLIEVKPSTSSAPTNNPPIIFLENSDDEDISLDDEEEEEDKDVISVEEDDINGDDDDDDFDDDQQNGRHRCGYLSYITDDVDDQILEIEPTTNMCLVYRRYDCQRFMKYINKSNNQVPFQQFSVVISEINDNE